MWKSGDPVAYRFVHDGCRSQSTVKLDWRCGGRPSASLTKDIPASSCLTAPCGMYVSLMSGASVSVLSPVLSRWIVETSLECAGTLSANPVGNCWTSCEDCVDCANSTPPRIDAMP